MLVVAAAWFAGWGHVAFNGIQSCKKAERAWFEADKRRDWASAELYRDHAEAARNALTIAVGVGFAMPLCFLVLYEARRCLNSSPRGRS